MSDEIKKEVVDNYKEHEHHLLYEPKCSTCWSENLRIQPDREDVREHNYNALHPRDGSTPWDKNRLD